MAQAESSLATDDGNCTSINIPTPKKYDSDGGATSPLTMNIWKDTVYASGKLKDVLAWLTWRDLNVDVLAKGETRTVLQGLTGYAQPGQLLAIMGPSGSGKSTLLDALAGRLATNTVLTGKVHLNGHKRKLSHRTSAYVTQEDNLTGTLTVKETIRYSAKLRLPDRMPAAEKNAVVESVMKEMGLQYCADTPVGNWHMRGISGGERRRLSIAIEILLRPRLLFLDEPTSGLDSAAAFFVTQTISNLARDGRTVVASIHQPSSEVFDLFDTLYILSGGRTVYFGQASEACNFFASAGFPCPSLRSPSDHFLRCVNADFDRVKTSLKTSHILWNTDSPDPFDTTKTTKIISTLVDSYGKSGYAMDASAKVLEISQRKGTALESCGSRASFLMQAATLTRRSFTNMRRDVGYYWLRLVIYIFVSLCVGTVYYNVGTSYNAILARGSCGSFVFGFVTFMSIGGFPSFVEDMKVFHRERMNGHYGVLAFVFGNSLSSVPFIFLIATATGSICYFMVRLHPGFVYYAYFTLGLFFSLLIVEGLMMAIASVVPNFLMGIITGAGIQGIFMLVAGYFRLPNDLPRPVWKYPVSYMSFDYWALQGQYQNDLHGLTFQGQGGVGTISGDYLLTEVFQIDVSLSKWWSMTVLFSMVFIYRIIFFVMIKVNEDITPWLRGYLAKRYLEKKNASSSRCPTPSPGSMSPVRQYISAASSLPEREKQDRL